MSLTIKLLMIVLMFSVIYGCLAPIPKLAGYNLMSPDASYILPDTLREVSGVTCTGPSTVACIQDENGIIFVYDIEKNQIKKQYIFNIDGDYEGIAKVNASLFILRSDGTIFEIEHYEENDFRVNTYITGILADNNEGLCYDALKNRLLIACKSQIGKGPEFKDKRAVYGFDLITRMLSSKPVYEFDIQIIKHFAVTNKIDLPVKEKKKGKPDEPVLKFRTSAIGIHPVTDQLYLISASDHMLFIFDREGRVEYIEKLNPVMFNKAEGITFFENGDMLITNEGQSKLPTLLRFNYKRH